MKKLFKSKLAQRFLMIFTGTAFIQFLNVVLSPILTRIYTPEDFGILTLFSSIMAILIVFGSFYYESAIPIAEDDEKSVNVLALCFTILIFITIVISLALLLYGSNILKALNADALIKYAFFIPIGLFSIGLYNILMKWNLKNRSFKNILTAKIGQGVTSNTIKISLGLLFLGPIGLLLGKISDFFVGSILLSFNFLKQKYLIKKIKISEMIWVAKRYVDFMIYSLPNAIVLSFTTQMPVFFLSFLYDSKIVGLYGLANSIIKLPMSLIGNSIGEVFYSEAAYIGKSNPKKVIELSNKLLKKLFLIGTIPFVILAIFGPQIFSIAFGSNWNDAGIYARMLSIGVFANFLFHPISRIYGIFEKQALKVVIDISRFAAIGIAFLIAGSTNIPPQTAVLIYSVLTLIFYFLTYYFAQKIMKNTYNYNKEGVIK